MGTPSATIVRTGVVYTGATPIADAVAASQNGDTININGGVGGDTTTYDERGIACEWDLTFNGTGDTRSAIIKSSQPVAKGIFLVGKIGQRPNVTFNHLHITSACAALNNGATTIGAKWGLVIPPGAPNQLSDGNAAGIRYQAGNLVVNDCHIDYCQNGILGEALVWSTGSFTITNCTFDHCGTGIGQQHNLYLSRVTLLTMTNCISTHSFAGQNVKIRALSAVLDSCTFGSTDADDYSGNQVQSPEGGKLIVKNCTLIKGPGALNPFLLENGGVTGFYPGTSTDISNCTFIDEFGCQAYFWNFLPIPMTAENITIRSATKPIANPILLGLGSYKGLTFNGAAIPDGVGNTTVAAQSVYAANPLADFSNTPGPQSYSVTKSGVVIGGPGRLTVVGAQNNQGQVTPGTGGADITWDVGLSFIDAPGDAASNITVSGAAQQLILRADGDTVSEGKNVGAYTIVCARNCVVKRNGGNTIESKFNQPGIIPSATISGPGPSDTFITNGGTYAIGIDVEGHIQGYAAPGASPDDSVMATATINTLVDNIMYQGTVTGQAWEVDLTPTRNYVAIISYTDPFSTNTFYLGEGNWQVGAINDTIDFGPSTIASGTTSGNAAVVNVTSAVIVGSSTGAWAVGGSGVLIFEVIPGHSDNGSMAVSNYSISFAANTYIVALGGVTVKSDTVAGATRTIKFSNGTTITTSPGSVPVNYGPVTGAGSGTVSVPATLSGTAGQKIAAPVIWVDTWAQSTAGFVYVVASMGMGSVVLNGVTSAPGAKVSMTGLPKDVTAALAAMQVIFAAAGADTLTVQLWNQGGVLTNGSVTGGGGGGGGGGGTVTGPQITGPASGSVDVNTALPITGLTIADDEQPLPGDCALNFSCKFGTVACTYAGTLYNGAQNSQFISVSDVFSVLQTVAGTLVYTSPSTSVDDVVTIGLYNQLGTYVQLDIPVVVDASGALAVPDLSVPTLAQTSLTLNWTNAGENATYEPAMALAGTQGFQAVATYSGSGLSAPVSGLTAGTNYDFRVTVPQTDPNTGLNADIVSQTLTVSTPVGTSPSAPGVPTVGSIVGNGATIGWTASTTGTTPIEYSIYYKLHNDANWTLSAVFSGATSQMLLSGLLPATEYDVLVVAANTAGYAATTPTTFTTGGVSGIPSDGPGPNSVLAKQSQDLCNRFGLNTHWGNGFYKGYNIATMIASLTGLNGIKLLRDSDGDISQYKNIASAVGCRFLLYIGEEPATAFSTALSQFRAFQGANPAFVLGYEGPNEPDSGAAFGFAETPTDAVNFQPNVWNAGQSDGVITVQWSIADFTKQGNYGDLSAYADYGNTHMYFNPNDYAPGDGRNFGNYFTYMTGYAQRMTPGKPVVVSEFGYQSTDAAVGQPLQGVYTLYYIFEAYQAGFAYFFQYAMMDDAAGNWGIFNADGTPRPCANYLANMLAILSDKGVAAASFAPGYLNYTISNFPPLAATGTLGGRQVLLQKSNGNFMLVLYNQQTQTPPPSATTIACVLNLLTAPTKVNIYDLTLTSQPITSLQSPGNTINFNLPEHPIVIEVIQPGAGGGGNQAPSNAPPGYLGTVGTPVAGDTTGTTAKRSADMMENFGVNTFSMTGTTNLFGSAGNYTAGGTIAALNWLQSSSGNSIRVREYHYDVATNEQAGWLPSVFSGTGCQFTICPGNGNPTNTGINTLAQQSAAGGGYITTLEGSNEPNNNSIAAAAVTTYQQSTYAEAQSLGLKTVQASIVVGEPFAEGWVTSYFGGNTNAINGYADINNLHYYPSSLPDLDDGSNRAGEMGDYITGIGVAFPGGKPLYITEWHPTLYNNKGHAADLTYQAYYAAMFILSAFRRGAAAYYWFSLFDYGANMLAGLFTTDSTTPKLPAYVIQAMFALLPDKWSNKHTFTPGKLNYTTTGLPAAINAASPYTGGQTLLLQNSNGQFFLFVWNAQVDPNGTAANATISFPSHSPAQIVEYNLTKTPASAQTPVQTVNNAASITISLAADVHLLVITY